MLYPITEQPCNLLARGIMESRESTKPLEHFLPQLLTDPYFEAVIRRTYPAAWDFISETARRGEVTGINALGFDLEDLIHDGSIDVSQKTGAGRENDPFHITVHQFGPLFWVSANEFDDVGYFASLTDAERYVDVEFDTFISGYSG